MVHQHVHWSGFENERVGHGLEWYDVELDYASFMNPYVGNF